MNRFKKLQNINIPFLIALVFTLLLYAWEEYLFGFPQIGYLRFQVFNNIENLTLGLLSTAYTFIICCLFVQVSLAAGKPFKLLSGFLFSVAMIVQYGYWQGLHRLANPIDFRTAIKSPFDLWLTSAELFFNWLSLLPIALYLILLVLAPKRANHSARNFGLIIVIMIGVNTLNFYTDPDSKRNTGISLTHFFQTLNSAILMEHTIKPRATVPLISQSKPQNNLVLIVDESIRSDHLSVNDYERSTTPYLKALAGQGYIHNWGTAVSGATCSFISNPLIITGLPVMPDNQPNPDEYPTLFQYAKAMGYQTHYLDAQSNYLWNGLYVGDLADVDHWVNTETLGNDIENDFRAADHIHQLVTSSVGNFVVLNKRGVHFLYEDSYPPEQTIWEPTPPNFTYRAYPELVANAYDNGIRYNVNTFFERLFPDVEAGLEQTIYLYTADHGETLFEGGSSALHCFFSKLEASVPLLLIGRLDLAVDTTYKASHSNIVPTLLDLMAVPADQYAYPYRPSLLTAQGSDSVDRFFLDGALAAINFDAGE